MGIEPGLSRLPFFSGNKNHAIGRPRTIDGGCIGIFQHLDAFNVIGVDGI